jgi:hypothetical protein
LFSKIESHIYRIKLYYHSFTTTGDIREWIGSSDLELVALISVIEVVYEKFESKLFVLAENSDLYQFWKETKDPIGVISTVEKESKLESERDQITISDQIVTIRDVFMNRLGATGEDYVNFQKIHAFEFEDLKYLDNQDIRDLFPNNVVYRAKLKRFIENEFRVGKDKK